MSQANLPRPGKSDLTVEQNLRNYIDQLVEELEYHLQNIDEDNFTEDLNNKLKGGQ